MKKKIPTIVKEIKEHKRLSIPRTDKNISYSQLLSFSTCPHQWYLTYIRKLGTYQPSIHTVFGTAMHETIQHWLDVMYETTVKEANQIDLHALLRENMHSVYKQEKARSGHEHFSNPIEMESFYNDGVQILDEVKRKRGTHFPAKNTYLVGVEIPIVRPLKEGLFFKGYIDLVFYNELKDKFLILDIKTSTSGWNKYAKKDDKKIAQLILYKEYFSEQFNVDVEKIDVEYFIVKRKVPDDPEFPAMGRRIQTFSPTAGKIKRAQIKRRVADFIDEAFTDTGDYVDKDYLKNASQTNCRFCEFRDNKYLCGQAVL